MRTQGKILRIDRCSAFCGHYFANGCFETGKLKKIRKKPHLVKKGWFPHFCPLEDAPAGKHLTPTVGILYKPGYESKEAKTSKENRQTDQVEPKDSRHPQDGGS